MNRAGKIALGCLLAPVAFLLILVIIFVGAKMAGVPEPSPTQTRLAQDIESDGQTFLEGSVLGSSEQPTPEELDAVRVILSIEEAIVELYSGPAEEGIKVDADYDEASFELTQEYGLDDDVPTYRLELHPRVHWLRRLMEDGSFEDDDLTNALRIQLPADTPMDLLMDIKIGEVEIDLTGLALTGLAAKLRMGEFDIDVAEPNRVPMGRVQLDCSMGEFQMHGLAYLGAEELIATGSMGEILIDLGVPLTRDTNLVTRMKMGEMRLNLPDNAVWDGDAKATFGEVTGSTINPGRPEPESPQLRYRCTVFMGEMNISAYQARDSRLHRR